MLCYRIRISNNWRYGFLFRCPFASAPRDEKKAFEPQMLAFAVSAMDIDHCHPVIRRRDRGEILNGIYTIDTTQIWLHEFPCTQDVTFA